MLKPSTEPACGVLSGMLLGALQEFWNAVWGALQEYCYLFMSLPSLRSYEEEQIQLYGKLA